MCLAADVPLVESGTTGFNGQVQVIKKVGIIILLSEQRRWPQQGKTECYDCNSKEVPKSFPVCTIRSTPSQPIHCIVWAKSYLLPYVLLHQPLGILHAANIFQSELFGTSEADAEEFDYSADADNGSLDPIALPIKRQSNFTDSWRDRKPAEGGQGSQGNSPINGNPWIYRKSFREGFQGRYWPFTGNGRYVEDTKGSWAAGLRSVERGTVYRWTWNIFHWPKGLDIVWKHDRFQRQVRVSIVTCVVTNNYADLLRSLDRLSIRLKKLQESAADSSQAILTFDKDDVDTLDFVTASANLRAKIFEIEMKSKFDTKRASNYSEFPRWSINLNSFLEMAGNIIPAIATTNAMTAGLCVLMSLKVLKDDYENAKMVR